ncbi:response regulator transcription factor [Candidatus Gracilibacteria bacterium]|nr:response regulator transcription factor [Candidatus Gracilibacteria bacterium]
MNILVVEDDIRLSDQIQEVFHTIAPVNQIQVIHSYDEFMSFSSSLGTYDIILLDIMLSEDVNRSGLQILEHIRKIDSQLPVIIMSSISDYQFLEKAFTLGAHDYIIKPFRVRELQIRVQRWFHNYVFSEYYNYEQQLDYDGLTYYPGKNTFHFQTNEIVLSKANRYLLSLFLIHREKLLTQEFLVEKIWGSEELLSTKNLRIKILRLKQQLAPHGIDHWIATTRGEGYIFQSSNPPVSEK